MSMSSWRVPGAWDVQMHVRRGPNRFLLNVTAMVSDGEHLLVTVANTQGETAQMQFNLHNIELMEVC